MPDPVERFIAAAVAPLGDNAELQMMAAQELRASILYGPLQEHCDSLESATHHLTAQRSRFPWRTSLYVLAALIAVAAAFPVIRDSLKIRVGMNSLMDRGTPGGFLPPGGNPVSRLSEIFGTLSAPQKLLLFGDPAASTWPDRYRVLRASDGMNPMLFADHARACSESTEQLPADLIATADLLDPDNGWFRHLAAGVEAHDATEFKKVPYRIAKQGGRFPDYRIKDPSGVAIALRRMAESAAATRYETYESEIYQKRLAVLPPGDDWVGRWLAVSYLESQPPGARIDRFHRDLAGVVAAEAWVLASSGHGTVLAKLAADWETCVFRSLQTPATSPLDLYSISSGIAIASPAIASAARELGQTELAERHEGWARDLKSLSVARAAGSDWSRIWEKGGIFTHNLDIHIEIDDDNLKPGRLADHAITRRFLTAGGLGIFAAGSLLFALTRYFRGYQPRRLSAALTAVLTPADHGWILAGGVLFPFAIHLLLDLATPLGMHDEGILHALDPLLFRYLLAGTVMFWLPLLMASRRLGCRLGILGWDRGACSERRLLQLATGLLLIAGFASLLVTESLAVSLCSWLALLGSVGTLLFILATAFSPRRLAVRWLALARATLPAQVIGVLLMALSSLAFHAREKHWVRNDRLSRIEPGIPAANRHQFEAAEGLRKALMEAIPPATLRARHAK